MPLVAVVACCKTGLMQGRRAKSAHLVGSNIYSLHAEGERVPPGRVIRASKLHCLKGLVTHPRAGEIYI